MNKARVSLYLPASLKTAAEEYARRDGGGQEVGAVEAAEFLRRRGAGGGRERALGFLRAAPDMPPAADDERMD